MRSCAKICKSCRSRQELSNECLLFTCKMLRRYSREGASQSLQKISQRLEKSIYIKTGLTVRKNIGVSRAESPQFRAESPQFRAESPRVQMSANRLSYASDDAQRFREGRRYREADAGVRRRMNKWMKTHLQTLRGSLPVVSKPMFASKYSCDLV